jgi:imidazolonepropionase
MIKVLFNPASIVTADTKGKGYKRGSEMNDVSILHNHSIVIEDDVIKDLVPDQSVEKLSADIKIDLKGKTVLPGLVESHTHLVFAGSRSGEFVLKLKGATYEDIARAGGGIMNTVRAVRESTPDDLYALAAARVQNFITQGVTTLEIKSGYGLDFENEIKLLKTISRLKENFPIDILPTFLGAHTYPAEHKNDHQKYINELTGKMIPYIAENKLAVFCDGFCESTAFSAEEIKNIFSSAKDHGLKLKLHTDQFNSIGGIDTALKLNAASVDHLEVLPDKYYEILGNSETVCTLLPGVSYFLNYQFAPARDLIDNNAIVSIATDYNPGSSNINNVFFIMSLAALKMKMSIPEIISAYTINAAKSVNTSSYNGSIETGKKADFAVYNTIDYNDLVYNTGQNLNHLTIKNGNIIWENKFENN